MPVVEGDLAAAFADPSNIVLTERVARKYFGDADPIGKPMTVIYAGKSHAYRVAAVLKDLPKNTNSTSPCSRGSRSSEDKASADYKSKHQWNYFNPRPMSACPTPPRGSASPTSCPRSSPATRRARRPRIPASRSTSRCSRSRRCMSEAGGETLAVATLGIVGVLTLLIAIVNYINLATARAGLRAREVAMRKVLGADRGTLARHYVGEASPPPRSPASSGSSSPSSVCRWSTRRAGWRCRSAISDRTACCCRWSGWCSSSASSPGSIRAIVLARMPAAAVLASARSPGGGRAGTYVREALVVFQFAIAIAFIIGTMVLVSQTRHVRNADLGYRRDGMMLVPSLGSAEPQQRAARQPSCTALAACPASPARPSPTTSRAAAPSRRRPTSRSRACRAKDPRSGSSRRRPASSI